MWKAAALVNGAWDELTPVELPAEPFTREVVRRVVRGRFPNSTLLHYFDQEAETPGAARDAIELWSQSAQAEANEFDWAGPAIIEALEETLALYPSARAMDLVSPSPKRPPIRHAMASHTW